MKPKLLRLLTLLATTALLLAASAASAPGAPAKAKQRSAGPAAAELWLQAASRPAPGSKLRLSPALRRALPKAGDLLAKEIGAIGRAKARASVAGASGAPRTGGVRPPVLEHYDGVIGREELGNGVVAEGRVRATVFEDYTHEAEIEFAIRDRKGNGILYTPDYSSLFAKDEEIECPTATGAVTTVVKGLMGGTVKQVKGKRVVASKTASQSWLISARGQVGTDARLQTVVADVTMTMKNYERGLQEETTVSATARLNREGPPKAGAPKPKVSVRAAGATRAEERQYELASERLLVGSPELAQALAGIGDHSRKRLLEAEPTWYALPNECAQIAWAPAPGLTLEPGETRAVTGVVVAQRDGGTASGRIDVTSVGRGRLIATTPSFSAAGPASMIAAAAEPDAAGNGVQAAVIATSTAGRAEATWFARATPVQMPERFVGTIASNASTAGLLRTFHGNATYTRTSTVRGPDGSIHAWYELTAASLGGAKEIYGPETGCRFEANGTAGNVESGDLELRVLPNGAVTYALLYDLKVPSAFAPTDCPPGPEAYDGEITVFLNSRRPGPVEGQLRPAEPGFWLSATQVGDVTDQPGITTTASWSLVPG